MEACCRALSSPVAFAPFGRPPSWCAEGKSYWETAVILGISERTVSFHMEAVRGKLTAGSNAHAVAIAARAGLLELGSGKASNPRRGLR